MAHMTFRGQSATLNIAAQTLVVQASGRVARVSVLVAGTAAGTLNDSATVGAAAAANAIAAIPNAVGVYEIDFPFSSGLVVSPGTGQTVAVTFTGVASISNTTE